MIWFKVYQKLVSKEIFRSFELCIFFRRRWIGGWNRIEIVVIVTQVKNSNNIQAIELMFVLVFIFIFISIVIVFVLASVCLCSYILTVPICWRDWLYETLLLSNVANECDGQGENERALKFNPLPVRPAFKPIIRTIFLMQ